MKDPGLSRREFLKLALAATTAAVAAPVLQACQRLGLDAPPDPTATAQSTQAPPEAAATETRAATPQDGTARLALVRTRERASGIRQALETLGIDPVRGRTVLIKPNFNSADPAPASTHPDTLRALAEISRSLGARSITIADRSGMGDTRTVMQTLGVFALADELGLDVLAFDELTDPEDWHMFTPPGSHWRDGFPFARACLQAGAILQTCCLKPHRFGGHFTLSLKNSVGMVGKFRGSGGHNYMTELHTSLNQRLMIAEINSAYTPALVVLDGVEAFLDQGPDTGTHAWGEFILAGTDRIAIDAVALSALRLLGLRGPAARGPVFEQQQIARAVELGLGVTGPEQIRILAPDPDSQAYADQILSHLLETG